MFTLLKHTLTIDGINYRFINIHATFEVKLTFAKLLRDSRVTGLDYLGQFETLDEARIIQAKMRNELRDQILKQ